MDILSRLVKYVTLLLWGGTVYYIIELLYRGHSHESMFILGGLCFLSIGALNNYLPWRMLMWVQMIIGGIVITVLELIAGMILNVWLGLGIWCYADTWGSAFWGQISIPFTLAWIALSLVAIVLDDFLRWKIFAQERPTYYWR